MMLPSIKRRSASVPNAEASGLMLNGQTLRQKMIPSADNIVQPIQQTIIEKPREQHLKVRRKQRIILGKGDQKILDGFAILGASGVGLPVDALVGNLSDRNFTGVAEDDLAFFSEMLCLDVSENYLQFSHFGNLPKLEELKLACNNIKEIKVGDVQRVENFASLRLLDLSYNQLSSSSVLSLGCLPHLKELNLCGNQLTSLPVLTDCYNTLEKLLLERNKLDSSQVFCSLACLPNLRELGLAYNFLGNVPPELCGAGTFLTLEVLDLAYNSFAHESSVEAVLEMPRIRSVLLYGNPFLGPTGEDPHQSSIRDLIAAANLRNDTALTPVELITEIPRERSYFAKKEETSQRLLSYMNLRIAAKGNRSKFLQSTLAEFMPSTSDSDHDDNDKNDADDVGDDDGVAVEEDLVPKVLPSKKKSAPNKELDFTFLTGADNEDDEEEVEEEEAVEEKEDLKEREKEENDSDSIDDSEGSASIRKQDELYRNGEGKKGMGTGKDIDSNRGRGIAYSTIHADRHMLSRCGSNDERDGVERKSRIGAAAGTGRRIGMGADVRTGTGARMGLSTRPGSDDTSTVRTVHSRGPSIRSSEGGHRGRRETKEKGAGRDEGNGGHRIGGDSDSLAQYARERCRSVAEMKYDRIFDNQSTNSDFSALRGSKALPLPLALSLPFPNMETHNLDSEGRDKGREEGKEQGRDMSETGISWVKSGDFSLEDIFERSTSSQVPQGLGLGPQSLNLRDAMAALRHAVQHPLSNQQEMSSELRAAQSATSSSLRKRSDANTYHAVLKKEGRGTVNSGKKGRSRDGDEERSRTHHRNSNIDVIYD